MKRIGICVLGMLLCHAAAMGQGYIGVFSDPQGTSCEFVEAYPGVMQVYIVHVDVPESIGSQFMVYESAEFTGVYLGEELGTGGIKSGNAPTGVSFGYGVCLSSPIHILTISYYVDGTSDPCSYLEIVPDPHAQNGEINTVDCDFETVILEVGGRGNFNVSAADPCDCSDPFALLPTEATTWSRVKAMYRD
ncbi:MAG: hypothetical protein JSW50_03950 [Candidatus Latescibacterota bacterium]|nr:MAG: hypothetical protein JSW50_03950 [Candidatus Latescibacterota bacterium]